MGKSYAPGSQNELLLRHLQKFYSSREKELESMLAIINGVSPISLRIVDWFTTNYSKQYQTVIRTNDKSFKVYMDYKLKLKAYSKKRFDPFCRWERLSLPYKDGQSILTTLGQLNFFKWALENGVIAYINDNYASIERDMNSRNSTSKRLKRGVEGGPKTRKKREELSKLPPGAVTREYVVTAITFA